MALPFPRAKHGDATVPWIKRSVFGRAEEFRGDAGRDEEGVGNYHQGGGEDNAKKVVIRPETDEGDAATRGETAMAACRGLIGRGRHGASVMGGGMVRVRGGRKNRLGQWRGKHPRHEKE